MTAPAPDPGRPPGEPQPPPAAEPKPGPITELFFDPAAEPSDDTPTVITRHVISAATAEGLAAGKLRGRRLAHFELLEPVGVGGMAAVLKAHDTQLDRLVALKVLPPEMAQDPENVRRFHQEARAAARLDHENIARVFYCGEGQGLHFIAFEFVEGENLRGLLDRRGRLPVPEALHYLLQVATGLAHAAARGVVHRDIKPSNIIITPTGRAKLVDMGLARALGAPPDKGLTQSGVTLGTFDYISPEQALEPRDADVRSDIYSLGCTFYHVLTGQPPVPEGTAAKKLNHHQHVAPIDPRQLNPDVPDEVTAVLARMMAKDPKERYQRAEHLVQHLIPIAQKLGAVAEAPDGVLFVDAPLPAPPRPRPVLLAAAAAAALAALVVALGQFSGSFSPSDGPVRVTHEGPREVRPNVPKADPGATPHPQPDKVRREDPPKKPAVLDGEPTAGTLAQWLQDHSDPEGAPRQAEAVVVLANNELDLSGDADADEPVPTQLKFRGRKLTFKAKDPGRPVTIRFADDGVGAAPPAVLAFDCEVVELSGLRLVVEARAPDTSLAALALGCGRHTVEACEFLQVRPAEREGRVVSLLMDATRKEVADPQLTLKSCYFAGAEKAVVSGLEGVALVGVERGGFEGVALAGPVKKVLATNCAFGPHAALFTAQNVGKLDLEVQSCSALLNGDAAVFSLQGETAGQLTARHCLFSRPGSEPGPDAPEEKGAVLVRLADEASAKFADVDNRYHNLDAFWDRPGPAGRLTAWDKFQQQPEVEKKDGQQSELLTESPWASAEPFKQLEKGRLREAFQPKTNLLGVRQKLNDRKLLVGLDAPLGLGTTYDKGLEPWREKGAVTRVVDPKLERPAGPNEYRYRSLSQALFDVGPGDTILIKHTGPLAERPMRLEQADLNVTIRPHPGSHPVLLLDEKKTTPEKDAALFRVYHGRVQFEGLEFLLRPGQKEFASQAVAALAGDGQCFFKDCVVTLDGDDKGVPLAAARLEEPAGVMKASGPPSRAAFRFENCFVRGDGDLVLARANRPFDLAADNALVAVTGSLLNVDNNRDNVPAAMPGQAVKLELARVTAYLGGHLVRLQAAKDAKAPMPVQVVEADDCLFAAPPPGGTLLRLEGPEADEDRAKALFPWKGKHNAYTNFTHLLDQQPRDFGDRPPVLLGQKDWKFVENDAQFNPLKFSDPPAAEAALVKVLPAQFKVKTRTDPPGYGADVDALPRPAGDGEARHD